MSSEKAEGTPLLFRYDMVFVIKPVRQILFDEVYIANGTSARMGTDMGKGFLVQREGRVVGTAASDVEDDVFKYAFVVGPIDAEDVAAVENRHGFSSSSKFSSIILTASTTKALKVQFFPRIAFSTSSITSIGKRIDLLAVGGI